MNSLLQALKSQHNNIARVTTGSNESLQLFLTPVPAFLQKFLSVRNLHFLRIIFLKQRFGCVRIHTLLHEQLLDLEWTIQTRDSRANIRFRVGLVVYELVFLEEFNGFSYFRGGVFFPFEIATHLLFGT